MLAIEDEIQRQIREIQERVDLAVGVTPHQVGAESLTVLALSVTSCV